MSAPREAHGFLCREPSLPRVLHSIKEAKMLVASVQGDAGLPLASLSVPKYTRGSRLIAPIHAVIEVVPSPVYALEVRDPVIGSDAVPVVNFRRPLSVAHRPSDLMRGKVNFKYASSVIAMVAYGSERFPVGKSAIPNCTIVRRTLHAITEHADWPRKPKQLSRLRLIAQQLATQFWRDIGSFSHRWSFHQVVRAARSLVASAWPVLHTRITICSQRFDRWMIRSADLDAASSHWVCRGRAA